MNEIKVEEWKDKAEKETEGETAATTSICTKMPTRKTRNLSSSSSTVGSSPPDGSSLSRQQRNLAEKQRRDKLNSYINELANLVPMVAGSTKKLDKTSVLRLSAAHLRLHHSCLNPQNRKSITSWRPNVFEGKHLNELLKAINGFLLVTTTTAKIIFTSKYVENYLGHQDVEMIGHSLFHFIHPDDHSYIRTELKKLAVSFHQNKNSNPVRSVFCGRMRERSQPRSEVINYQLMRFNCTYSNEGCVVPNNLKHSITGRRAKTPVDDIISGLVKYYMQTVNVNPFDELSIAEAFQEEYVTRHGLSGEILYADHRISTITGHLPHEVIGMLAYDYIFPADVPVAQFAQRLMFSSSDGRGAIVYRLKSRDSTAIYLKTFGQLQYEKSSTKISHFICVNKLLGEEEGKEELKKFNDRYSPRINEYLAYSHHDPLALDSGQTRQMIENGSFQSKSKSTHSSNFDSPFHVAHCPSGTLQPSLSSEIIYHLKDTVNSGYSICRKSGIRKVLGNPTAEYGSNHADHPMTQMNKCSGILDNNDMLSKTKLQVVSRAAVNNSEISRCTENQIFDSEMRIQQKISCDYSTTIRRKRAADVLSYKIGNSVALPGNTKHLKYCNGMSHSEVSGKKQLIIPNSNHVVQPNHVYGAEFVDNEWLNYLDSSTLSPGEQQTNGALSRLSVSQNNYSNGKTHAWNNYSGDSSYSGDEHTTTSSPDKAEMDIELIDTSDSEKSWLPGTLQKLYP